MSSVDTPNPRILHREICYRLPNVTKECCSHSRECQSTKDAVKRSHRECLQRLLDAGCEWWIYTLTHLFRKENYDLLLFCLERDAPRMHTHVISCLMFCELSRACELRPACETDRYALVKTLLSKGQCEYYYDASQPTKLKCKKEPYDVNTISLVDLLFFERYNECMWMYTEMKARVGLQEAEQAARRGYADILEIYFSQPAHEGETGRPLLKSWLLFRNAYRSGSLKCLNIVIREKCPCPVWILEVESTFECYEKMLDVYDSLLLTDDIFSQLEINRSPLIRALEVSDTRYINAVIIREKWFNRCLTAMEETYYYRKYEDYIYYGTMATVLYRIQKMTMIDRLAFICIHFSKWGSLVEWLINEKGANVYFEVDVYYTLIEHVEMIDWCFGYYSPVFLTKMIQGVVTNYSEFIDNESVSIVKFLLLFYHAFQLHVDEETHPPEYFYQLLLSKNRIDLIRLYLHQEICQYTTKADRHDLRIEFTQRIDQLEFAIREIQQYIRNTIVLPLKRVEREVTEREQEVNEHEVNEQEVNEAVQYRSGVQVIRYLNKYHSIIKRIRSTQAEVKLTLSSVGMYNDLLFLINKFVC